MDFGAKLENKSKTQLFQFRLFFEEKAIEFLCVVDHGQHVLENILRVKNGFWNCKVFRPKSTKLISGDGWNLLKSYTPGRLELVRFYRRPSMYQFCPKSWISSWLRTPLLPWCFQPMWKTCSSNWITFPPILRLKIQNILVNHLTYLYPFFWGFCEVGISSWTWHVGSCAFPAPSNPPERSKKTFHESCQAQWLMQFSHAGHTVNMMTCDDHMGVEPKIGGKVPPNHPL